MPWTITTHAIGEEDPETSLAEGEENPPITTHAEGEEDSTMALGEEDPIYTTQALGEEGPDTLYPVEALSPFGAF